MVGNHHKYHGFGSGSASNKSSQVTPQNPTPSQTSSAPIGRMSIEDSLKSALRQRNKPKNCKSCYGKLRYEGRGRYICEACSQELITNYGKVREFLDITGGATIVEVCDATGLSRREVKELIDDGSIQMVGGRYTIGNPDW